jgi:hypothetical protein
MIDDDECGAVGEMRIGRRNRSTRRKVAPVPFFPPQIQQDLTWDQTRTAAAGGQRLTARDMHYPGTELILRLLSGHSPEVFNKCLQFR